MKNREFHSTVSFDRDKVFEYLCVIQVILCMTGNELVCLQGHDCLLTGHLISSSLSVAH